MVGNLQEKLNERNIFDVNNKSPNIADDVFIASGVKIIGDVRIGEGSSIWFNSVLRGDINFIQIGKYSNIQDLCTLHLTKKSPLIIGDYVTVGHNAVLHACTIKNNVLIGMNAIVLDDSIVEENVLVAAGSVVTPNTVIPSGKLVAGIPAKVIRDLSEDEIAFIHQSALNYYQYALEYKLTLKEK